jgi:hypothetical protein
MTSDEELERLALDGHIVLSVPEAEELYYRRGDSAAFEALAAAVNEAEADRTAPEEP